MTDVSLCPPCLCVFALEHRNTQDTEATKGERNDRNDWQAAFPNHSHAP